MSTVSVHVLDAAFGVPAVGLAVVLDPASAGPEVHTDADGRIRFIDPVAPGQHELQFATGPWFADQDRGTFFPIVQIAFEIDPGAEHHHVALLLSPYAYTTYRGS